MGDLYRIALHACEHLANSYRFWRFGPIRVVNHAIWSFAAGAVGVLLIGYLAGPSHLPAVILVAMTSLIGAMLWAQLLEGSPRLLRPFGYYGAIVGGVLGCMGAWLLGTSPWLILAATSAAAPAIQAIGRVRCLVQGCCHGKPSSGSTGLRVSNPSSRVCVLGHLGGVPIHPTQLYSILGNLVVSTLLLRLYLAGCSQNIIVGLYLAMAGLSRFVEESYRGEPQTRKWFGLPEYQWLAILSLLSGCILLAIPLSRPVPVPEGSIALLWVAAMIGCVTAVLMSVDFPDSQRRFARLTG
jgi:prolipoprotein diacylglyceryltransferase